VVEYVVLGLCGLTFIGVLIAAGIGGVVLLRVVLSRPAPASARLASAPIAPAPSPSAAILPFPTPTPPPAPPGVEDLVRIVDAIEREEKILGFKAAFKAMTQAKPGGANPPS
jgi:hypothetical protein